MWKFAAPSIQVCSRHEPRLNECILWVQRDESDLRFFPNFTFSKFQKEFREKYSASISQRKNRQGFCGASTWAFGVREVRKRNNNRL